MNSHLNALNQVKAFVQIILDSSKTLHCDVVATKCQHGCLQEQSAVSVLLLRDLDLIIGDYND